MPSAKITSKGQVTIPQEVRRAMGVSEGDRVEFVHMPDGGFVMKRATRSIRDLKGIIPLRRKPATIEEMQEAIVAGASKGIKVHRRAHKK
jgi:AbrB family looped-hinge helix DNA binding protein